MTRMEDSYKGSLQQHAQTKHPWIVQCLEEGLISIPESPCSRTCSSHKTVLADKKTILLLKNIVESTRRPGFYSFLQPYCKMHVPVFAALGVGWQLHETARGKQTTLLVTQNPQVEELLETIHVNEHPIRCFYPVARIGRSHALFVNFVTHKFRYTPRLILTDELSYETVSAILNINLTIGAILIDGCSAQALNPFRLDGSFAAKLADAAIIHLSPVRVQRDPSFPEPPPLAVRNELPSFPGEPLLVCPESSGMKLEVRAVSGQFRDIWELLRSVHQDGSIKRIVVQQILALQSTLAALPVPVSLFNELWKIPSHIIAHPILDRITSIRSLSEKLYVMQDNDSNRIAEILNLLENAAREMTSASPKGTLLMSLLKETTEGDGNYIITANRTMRNALQLLLEYEGIDVTVHYWRDKGFTSFPVEGRVIITSPPPKDHEWKLAIPLSSKLCFVLWPFEARVLTARMKKAGFSVNTAAYKKIMSIATGAAGEQEPADIDGSLIEQPSDMLERILLTEPLELSPHYGVMPSGDDQKLGEMIPVELYPAGTLWMRLKSSVSVIKESRIRSKKSSDLQAGDYIVISEGTADSGIFQALVTLAEKKNEQVVRTARLWRTALLDYINRENLSIDALRAVLAENGLSVHRATVRSWVTGDDTRAVIGPLDKNAVGIIGSVTGDVRCIRDERGITESITMVRGLHVNQGLILNRLVKLCALDVDSDAEQVLEETFGITLTELRGHIRFFQIQSIGTPCEAPLYLAGTVTG